MKRMENAVEDEKVIIMLRLCTESPQGLYSQNIFKFYVVDMVHLEVSCLCASLQAKKCY